MQTLKNERHKRILALIEERPVDTQEEMLRLLRQDGFHVTQATVSRDLRELDLTKILSKDGIYCYAVNPLQGHAKNARLNSAIVDSITRMDYSMNNVVLKTYPGMAQAVASAVDGMSLPNVLGCVAGDDTIILVTRDEATSAEVVQILREGMKK
jgi:transcriptional regulator of arginine metabolism